MCKLVRRQIAVAPGGRIGSRSQQAANNFARDTAPVEPDVPALDAGAREGSHCNQPPTMRATSRRQWAQNGANNERSGTRMKEERARVKEGDIRDAAKDVGRVTITAAES